MGSIRTFIWTILRADMIAFVIVILGALLSVAYAMVLVSRAGGPQAAATWPRPGPAPRQVEAAGRQAPAGPAIWLRRA